MSAAQEPGGDRLGRSIARARRRRFPAGRNAWALLLGFVLSVLVVVLVEATSRIYLTTRPQVDQQIDRSRRLKSMADRPERNRLFSAHLGAFHAPASQERSRYVLEGETIWDVEMNIDEYGRRVTAAGEGEAREYVLMIGGSFTFGTGVPDDETLPSQLAREMGNVRAYNYGMSGGAAHHMLSRLSNVMRREEVAESGGWLVYVFIDPHIDRTTGSMAYLRWSEGFTPYYYLDGGGRLVRDRNFNRGRQFTTWLYKLLGRSALIEILGFDLPGNHLAWTEEQVRLTARVIHSSALAFREKFGSDDFVVLFFPGSQIGMQRLAPHLDRLGVRYLDYTHLFAHVDEVELEFPEDGHPTAAAYGIVAERLARDLAQEP